MSETIIHHRLCQWTPGSLFGCSCGDTDKKPILDDDSDDWETPL